MNDAHDLGLLLRFALSRRARPSQNADYRRLVERLQRDGAFKAAFSDLAAGLGLFVLAADDYGVVLGCRDDSPMAMRLGDFRSGMSRDDRMVYGLLLLATASWCFPRASELDTWGDAVKRVSVTDLAGYVSELAARLDQRAEQDASADHPELREAWRTVLSKAQEKPTKDGRRSASSLAGMAKYLLERLESAGLLVRDGDERYKTTRAFRVQLRELAANEAFRLVRGAEPEQEAM